MKAGRVLSGQVTKQSYTTYDIRKAMPLSWPQGYKNFFMLSSVENEILNAHKYKNIKKKNRLF